MSVNVGIIIGSDAGLKVNSLLDVPGAPEMPGSSIFVRGRVTTDYSGNITRSGDELTISAGALLAAPGITTLVVTDKILFDGQLTEREHQGIFEITQQWSVGDPNIKLERVSYLNSDAEAQGADGQSVYIEEGDEAGRYYRIVFPAAGVLNTDDFLFTAQIRQTSGAVYPADPLAGDYHFLESHASDPDGYYDRIGGAWVRRAGAKTHFQTLTETAGAVAWDFFSGVNAHVVVDEDATVTISNFSQYDSAVLSVENTSGSAATITIAGATTQTESGAAISVNATSTKVLSFRQRPDASWDVFVSDVMS